MPLLFDMPLEKLQTYQRHQSAVRPTLMRTGIGGWQRCTHLIPKQNWCLPTSKPALPIVFICTLRVLAVRESMQRCSNLSMPRGATQLF